MPRTFQIIVAISGVAVLIVLVWFLGLRNVQKSQVVKTTSPSPRTSVSPKPQATVLPSPTGNSPTPTPAELSFSSRVSILNTGFSPKEVKIVKGSSVSWVNTDSKNHRIESNPHPAHTSYKPLNIGILKPGELFTLTFPDPGTYEYHDHLNPQFTGKVVVE